VCCCRCLLARPIARQAEARIRRTIGKARPTLLAGSCRQRHIGRDVVVVRAGAQRGNLAGAGQAGDVAATHLQPGCAVGGTDQHQRPLQGGRSALLGCSVQDDGMDGPSFEYHLFKAATGVDWSEEELDRACERIINLDRGLQIRDFGRSRRDDEGIIPYLEREENHVNPLIGQKQALDGAKFRQLMTEFYRLRGWDPETGWPTKAKLDELGLPEVAADLSKRKPTQHPVA